MSEIHPYRSNYFLLSLVNFKEFAYFCIITNTDENGRQWTQIYQPADRLRFQAHLWHTFQ